MSLINVKIIVFVFCVHYCIGDLPSAEKDSLHTDGPGIPSVTSGQVSGSLRNILNQESLVRFAMVQRMQRLVLDMTEVKSDFKDLQRTVVDLQEKLQTLETKDQRLENENAELKQSLQTIYTRHQTDELANIDFQDLKNETLKLRRKYDNLSLENNAFQNQLNYLNGQMKKIDDLSTHLHIVEGSMQNLSLSVNASLENISEDLNTSCTQPVTEPFKLHSDGIETCLVDPQCFVQQEFTYDDSFNSCYGDMYIKNSTYDPGKYVGIILCSPTRYHLFMGDDIDGMFYNIGDGSGHGGDHCELVGGTDSTAIKAPDFKKSPNTQGYYRSHMNQPFAFGDIGYLGKSHRYFGTWIECGITIPDDVIVYRREISDLK